MNTTHITASYVACVVGWASYGCSRSTPGNNCELIESIYLSCQGRSSRLLSHALYGQSAKYMTHYHMHATTGLAGAPPINVSHGTQYWWQILPSKWRLGYPVRVPLIFFLYVVLKLCPIRFCIRILPYYNIWIGLYLIYGHNYVKISYSISIYIYIYNSIIVLNYICYFP